MSKKSRLENKIKRINNLSDHVCTVCSNKWLTPKNAAWCEKRKLKYICGECYKDYEMRL